MITHYFEFFIENTATKIITVVGIIIAIISVAILIYMSRKHGDTLYDETTNKKQLIFSTAVTLGFVSISGLMVYPAIAGADEVAMVNKAVKEHKKDLVKKESSEILSIENIEFQGRVLSAHVTYSEDGVPKQKAMPVRIEKDDAKTPYISYIELDKDFTEFLGISDESFVITFDKYMKGEKMDYTLHLSKEDYP